MSVSFFGKGGNGASAGESPIRGVSSAYVPDATGTINVTCTLQNTWYDISDGATSLVWALDVGSSYSLNSTATGELQYTGGSNMYIHSTASICGNCASATNPVFVLGISVNGATPAAETWQYMPRLQVSNNQQWVIPTTALLLQTNDLVKLQIMNPKAAGIVFKVTFAKLCQTI